MGAVSYNATGSVQPTRCGAGLLLLVPCRLLGEALAAKEAEAAELAEAVEELEREIASLEAQVCSRRWVGQASCVCRWMLGLWACVLWCLVVGGLLLLRRVWSGGGLPRVSFWPTPPSRLPCRRTR